MFNYLLVPYYMCNQENLNIFYNLQALGGTLLVLGIYLKLEYQALDGISDDNFGTWVYVIIIVGGVIFFISFLGCCGTLLQSNNLLMLVGML